jgi:hypothetical protein
MKQYVLCFFGYLITSVISVSNTIQKTVSPEPTPYKMKNNQMLPMPYKKNINNVLPPTNKRIENNILPSQNKIEYNNTLHLDDKNHQINTKLKNYKLLILIEFAILGLIIFACYRKQLNIDTNEKKNDYDLPFFIKQIPDTNKSEPRYRRTASHEALYNV